MEPGMVAADTSLKSLDEINGLDALWAAVTAFNISFWLNLWAFEIRKKPLISIISPGDNYDKRAAICSYIRYSRDPSQSIPFRLAG